MNIFCTYTSLKILTVALLCLRFLPCLCTKYYPWIPGLISEQTLSIKTITETVVNMNIVAHIKFSSNLKKSSSAVGYYSYTNRCGQCRNDGL